MRLEGRVALVTGAGGEGIGRSIALTLARDGADLLLNYHVKDERVAQTAQAIEAMGRRALPFAADVSDVESINVMMAVATAEFGHVDVLVNSAGGPWKPLDITEIPPEHFRDVLAREVESTFLLMRAVLPGMRERGWGRIVSIGGYEADNWRYGPPDAPLDYPMGKAMRHWLTRTLGPREIGAGITINAVAPGPTPRVTLEQALAAVEGRASGAGDKPQDIADIVAYLCSDAAARVTGAVIPVPRANPV